MADLADTADSNLGSDADADADAGERLEQSANEAWLPPDLIRIDPTVNTRPLSELRARKLAEGFDANAMGTIYVSWRPSGEFVCIDGQHRLRALQIMGMGARTVRCLVYEDLTHEQEARLFYDLNAKRNPPPAVANFHALWEAKDEDALLISEVLARFGLRVAKDANELGANVVLAIAATRDVFGRGGADHLHAVFDVVTRAWPDDQSAVGKEPLTGVSLFLLRYPEVDTKGLAERLSSWTPTQLKREVQQVRQEFQRLPGMHGRKTPAAGVAVLNAYNRGRRNRLPNRWPGGG